LRRIPPPLRAGAIALLAKSHDHRLRKIAQYARRTPDDALLLNATGIDDRLVSDLVRLPQPAQFDYRQRCIEEARASGSDDVAALAELDFQTYLVSILNRQDKMSMATSIEARVPFLDNEIIELARSLPLAFKQTLRHRKRVLKDAALRYLPQEIVHRRKSGFGVPLSPWFAAGGPMARTLESVCESRELEDLLDTKKVAHLLAAHRRGPIDYSELLWSVLNIALWRRSY
jgi:asparagine synthase (glutamine-hydrolysing)